MELKTVTLETEDSVCVFTINNPPLNALDGQVMEDMEQAVDYLEKHPVRAVVITGGGNKSFVAGADISQFLELDKDSGRAFVRRWNDIWLRIENYPGAVIAAINGFALGGGLELALACDIRIMANTAKVSLPETTLGLYPGIGGTQRLARLIGPGKAKLLLFSGMMISAQEAGEMGICEKVVEPEMLMEEALKLARQIAKKTGAIAIKEAKYVMNCGLDMDLAAGIALEVEHFGVLCETEDMKEGSKAFLEKRPANFTCKL